MKRKIGSILPKKIKTNKYEKTNFLLNYEEKNLEKEIGFNILNLEKIITKKFIEYPHFSMICIKSGQGFLIRIDLSLIGKTKKIKKKFNKSYILIGDYILDSINKNHLIIDNLNGKSIEIKKILLKNGLIEITFFIPEYFKQIEHRNKLEKLEKLEGQLSAMDYLEKKKIICEIKNRLRTHCNDLFEPYIEKIIRQADNIEEYNSITITHFSKHKDPHLVIPDHINSIMSKLIFLQSIFKEKLIKEMSEHDLTFRSVSKNIFTKVDEKLIPKFGKLRLYLEIIQI